MAAAPRSLLAFWAGGASTPHGPCAVRSMLAPWMGGACTGVAPTVQAAYRGLMAFWAGGGSSGPAEEPPITPLPTPQQPGGIPQQQPRRFRIRPRHRDEDDVVALTLTILQLVNNQ